MRVQIKKSGNSAILRIPSDVLKELELSIGTDLSMTVTKNGLSFEKITQPRDRWFDDVCPKQAAHEGVMMEKEFGDIHSDGLDDWSLGEEW